MNRARLTFAATLVGASLVAIPKSDVKDVKFEKVDK